eukprot:3440642-Rhodomonas_salina.1
MVLAQCTGTLRPRRSRSGAPQAQSSFCHLAELLPIRCGDSVEGTSRADREMNLAVRVEQLGRTFAKLSLGTSVVCVGCNVPPVEFARLFVWIGSAFEVGRAVRLDLRARVLMTCRSSRTSADRRGEVGDTPVRWVRSAHCLGCRPSQLASASRESAESRASAAVHARRYSRDEVKHEAALYQTL